MAVRARVSVRTEHACACTVTYIRAHIVDAKNDNAASTVVTSLVTENNHAKGCA